MRHSNYLHENKLIILLIVTEIILVTHSFFIYKGFMTNFEGINDSNTSEKVMATTDGALYKESFISSFQNASQQSIEIFTESDFIKYGFPGSGTKSNPYKIQNFTFTASKNSLIKIQNTKSFFSIEHNRLDGQGLANYGIELNNVSNGMISRNIVKENNLFGILIRFSNNILIQNNFITNNVLGGIYSYSSQDVTITMNAIHYNKGYAIILRERTIVFNILRNAFINNTNYAILLGMESDKAHPNVELTYINENTFINNNANKSDVQACDWGKNNIFSSNYWNTWLQDENLDGWVDAPYKIEGEFNTTDSSPKTSYPIPELISPLILLYPSGGEKLAGKIVIDWTTGTNPTNTGIVYSLKVSKDLLTWQEIGIVKSSFSYIWDTESIPKGDYYLKIIATNKDGSSISVVTEKKIEITKQNVRSIPIFELVGGVGLLLALACTVYIMKIKSRSTSKGAIQSFKPDFLRTLFHKIIIGLENVKAETTQNFLPPEVLGDYSDSTTMVNIYPNDLRNEMKSKIKGKSVLILIELAYQPLHNSHTSYIAKVLDIPQQTVSDEIKRLINLEYLNSVINENTLADTRYKYYSVSKKGILFLHLLKESIRVTLLQVHSNYMNPI